MSQRETLLQPSRLPAANSTPEKWPGQSTFLARPAGCVGVWENMEQHFSTHSIWTHRGRWLGWNLKMFKQKKKEQDVGTDYRLNNPIWSHLPTPSLWRDIHSLVNVRFLERYTKTLLEMGKGNLNIKETFILLCIIPFALLFFKIIKMHLFFVSRYSGHLFIVS